MDPLTIVIALLTAVIAVLTAPMWLGHLDTAKILGRMDRDIEWVDRSATAPEHAANGARKPQVERSPTRTIASVSRRPPPAQQPPIATCYATRSGSQSAFAR